MAATVAIVRSQRAAPMDSDDAARQIVSAIGV